MYDHNQSMKLSIHQVAAFAPIPLEQMRSVPLLPSFVLRASLGCRLDLKVPPLPALTHTVIMGLCPKVLD